ncbi:MAG: hypothetical protein IJ920_06725 [Paludibacteraceae bacterium]|nr:hypothetical protein [Paludibacteraceae bacterium]
MNKKLNIIATIKDGIAIALVNFLSLILTTLLFIVTVWIPYLNVGTTIAMESLPAELAKGKVINPLFIFESKYRKNMGEFFILMALMTGAISVGLGFGFIPGIVIAIAWDFAIVLFVDKDMSALDALRESNRLTYGHKARIFGISTLVIISLCIVCSIILGIFGIGEIGWLEAIGGILVAVLVIFAIPALLGIDASIYRQLTTGEFLDAPAKEEAAAPAAPEAPKAEAPKAV